ncbi:PocR ligand-binding domain-containing protein, partial [Enterococcus sp. S181_ASV_20]|nr:PocR ligand-binding domain-containing protein [Enterococcus sp. S181_ASV_20]
HSQLRRQRQMCIRDREIAACENCQMHQMIYPIKKRSINKYLCHAGFTHVPLPVYINNILVGYLIIGRLAEAQNRHLIEKNQSSNAVSYTHLTLP